MGSEGLSDEAFPVCLNGFYCVCVPRREKMDLSPDDLIPYSVSLFLKNKDEDLFINYN